MRHQNHFFTPNNESLLSSIASVLYETKFDAFDLKI